MRRIAIKCAAAGFLAVLIVGCGGDDSSSTDTVVDSLADTSTMVEETNAPATETTAPESTLAATTLPASDSTSAVAALPAVQILDVAAGAGGGEAFVMVDQKPASWAKFSVSMSADGVDSSRTKVLDVQEMNGGATIIVDAAAFFGKAPLNVAVSWTDIAGAKSELAYFTCNAGITAGGC